MRTILILLAFVAVAVFAQQCPRCTPLCQNGDGSTKVCGSDGCGGSCGTCPAGQTCCRGQCACQPNCAGRQCGDDGCGYQSCGQCSSTQTCSNGVCTGTAVAECAGRVCGSNRAGGSCGTCPTGQRCRGGVCECYYDCNDRNCGTAPQAAGVNTGLCPQRSCGTCPTGFTCNAETGLCSQSQNCFVNVSVVDCATRQPIVSVATVTITRTGYTVTGTVPVSGVYVWETPGTGTFNISTTASGYQPGNEQVTTTATTTTAVVCLNRARVNVDVRDRATDQSITVSASVAYSGFASGSFQWNGIYVWDHPGFGTYTLVATPASPFGVGSVTVTIDASTTNIIIYVDSLVVRVDIRDRATDQSITVSASVAYSGFASGSFQWNGIYTWNHPGFGQYTLTATPASAYQTGSVQATVNAQTSLIIIYVDANPIEVQVRNRATDQVIEVNAQVTYTGVASGSFQWTTGTRNLWTHGGYGSYTFTATPASRYSPGSETVTVSGSTSLIIIYVVVACGDGTCSGSETYSNCRADCVYLLLEMEDADGTGPVTQTTVNYYLTNPRVPNQETGPNKDPNVVPGKTRNAVTGSNVVAEQTYSLGDSVYIEATANGFINFYWLANTSQPLALDDGVFRLRVHLSKVLQTSDLNYRMVNTWKPTDVTPSQPAPTDLNLHLFHPQGALDWTEKTLIIGGEQRGRAVADNKQSGGPATMDISPGSAQMVAVWNSKPPRDPLLAPAQNGRFLIHSGSYVVVYGKTSNAAGGKQLGQIILNEYLISNPTEQQNTQANLWYIADFVVSQPAQNQPSITARNRLKFTAPQANNDLIFDCEAYTYCAQFVVPYSDSTKKRHDD